MGDVVNLRRARKAKARATAGQVAAANRVVHGRSKGQRSAEIATAQSDARRHEAHKLDRVD